MFHHPGYGICGIGDVDGEGSTSEPHAGGIVRCMISTRNTYPCCVVLNARCSYNYLCSSLLTTNSTTDILHLQTAHPTAVKIHQKDYQPRTEAEEFGMAWDIPTAGIWGLAIAYPWCSVLGARCSYEMINNRQNYKDNSFPNATFPVPR